MNPTRAGACDERLNYFDLEDAAHVDRLTNPKV